MASFNSVYASCMNVCADGLHDVRCMTLLLCRINTRGSIYWSVYGPTNANYSDSGVAAGSAYVDIAILDLDTTMEWWMAAEGISFASCGTKRAIADVEASGYPGVPPFGFSSWPHTVSGSITPVDFCDAKSDTAKSSDMYSKPGMSGGPLYLKWSHQQIAVVSGTHFDPKNESCHYDSLFAPLDTFNMPLISGVDKTGTLWSRSSECFCRCNAHHSMTQSRCLSWQPAGLP